MIPNRLTVCQLVQGLAIGGLERVVVDLSSGLDRTRFQSVVCCYDELGPFAETLAAAGVPVVLERRRPGKDWRYPWRLARRLRALGADVLHAHNQTAFFYGVAAARLARIGRIVYTEHDRTFPSPTAVRFSDGLLARMTHCLFTVSDAVRREWTATERLPQERIGVAYNGVDGRRFDPAADPAAARVALGLPEAPTVGIVARLSPEKNHALLFAAFARLGGRGQRSEVGEDQAPPPATPDPYLLVVGDGPERERLTAEADRLGLRDRVRFLGARGDVPQCLAAMDVCVLSSKTEGLPLTPIEAMAAGRPVIVTDVGGCRELVEEGRTGYVVPAGDAEALAARIAALLADPYLRRRMGVAARRRFEDHFSLERMVAVYEASYAGQR